MKKQKTNNKNSLGIEPLADRVLIKEEDTKKTKTDSGIYIPDTAKEDRGSKRGTVVAVGPGRMDDGKLVVPGVSVGQKVLFQWGDQISVEGEEYFLVREAEVIAIIR